MISIRYPEPDLKIRTEQGRRQVFDPIRKNWLLLTEEEWVRQNFLQYLVRVLHYPAAMIALEKEIRLHELTKRFDILVYDAGHKPWMLVECKEPGVPLGEAVLQQALRYHLSVPVQYIIITNGPNTVGWRKEQGELVAIDSIPAFAQ